MLPWGYKSNSVTDNEKPIERQLTVIINRQFWVTHPREFNVNLFLAYLTAN